MIQFSQGETIKLQVPFSNEDGSPVDFSTATSIRAYFVIKEVIASKFQDATLESPISGYGSIVQVDAYTLEFDITNEISKALPVGNITISVGTIFPTGKEEYLKEDAATVTKGYVLRQESYT